MLKSRGVKVSLVIVLIFLLLALLWLWRKNVGLADNIQTVEKNYQAKITEQSKKGESSFVNTSGDTMSGKLEIKSDLSAVNAAFQTINSNSITSASLTTTLANITNLILSGGLDCTNCIELGAETTGNYLASLTAGADISISGSAGEGGSLTVADISTLQSVASRGALTTNAITINSTGDNLILQGDGTIQIVQSVGPGTTADRLYNVAGNLVWNGVNLSGAGPMPVGLSGQTMRHDGANWIASSLLFNNGTNIGIGDTSPLALLTVGSGDLFQVNSSGQIAAAAGITSSGTITFSGLSASRLLSTNGSSSLASVANLSSWVAGTANRVTVTDNGSGGITLNLPQDIHTGASPTFTGLTISGLTASRLMASNGSSVLASVANLSSWIAGTANRVTVADNGSGGITLNLPQDIHSGAIPTFTGLTLSGLSASRLLSTNGSSALASVSTLSSWIAGTANQITVTDDGDGSITLSAPQNIGTGNSPIFTGLTLSGLTQGSVIFAGAGGVISQNNANFFWDNAITRLGIGTAPSYKVHIVDSSTTASTSALYVSQTGVIVGTGYGMYVTKTGGSTTNVGGYFSATGATNNYGLIVENGLVGLGTTTPEFRLTLDKSAATPDGGILSIGTYGSGTTLTTAGAGTRLIWYPQKAAFRVGGVDGTQWNNASIGNYSAAMGYKTTASGPYSFATGESTSASGWRSFAIGESTSASGGRSFAAGYGTSASGNYSFAIGFNTIASNDQAVAIGYGGTASGVNSFVGGQSSDAAGGYSFSYGYNSTASGDYSFSIGQYVTAGAAANAVTIGRGVNNTDRLVNNTAQSLSIGFNSTIPTLFVGPSTGVGTTGNVGVGTTTLTHKLNIVDTGTTASRAGVYVSQTGAIVGTGYAGYFSKTGGSTTNVGLYASASGATYNYAAVFPSGFVGIGTATPLVLAHISQSSLGTEALRIESTATNDDPNYRIFQNRVATADATPTAIHTFTLTDENTYFIEARITSRRTGGAAGAAGDSASYIILGTFKRVGGGVATQVGTTTKSPVQEDQAGWDVNFNISVNDVQVQVAGAADNNVTWHTTVMVQNLST